MADRNGYFQIAVRDEGTFIHIFPPEGAGEQVSTAELSDYLTERNLVFDLIEIDAATKKMEESEIKLSREGILAERESMTITISPDGMEVHARFIPPFEGGELMAKSEIINDLRFNHVTFGIIEKAIDEFIEDRKYCTDILLAKGVPVKEGKDAYIEYLFNTDLSQRPTQNEDGSVDYHHLNNICLCTKGQVIARMIPVDPGTPGKSVRGEIIQPKIPRKVLFQHGKNIIKSEDGLELISDVNGHVTLVDEKVFVSGVLELTDVDPSTGNIEYDGNVLVTGNIHSGFEVVATGDVEVRGNVEGAYVKAGGQIIINRGINGMGKGVLESDSNILSKYIENATVHAGGYVETDCILHSTVSAGSHVVVQGKRGFITGGVVRATAYVEAKTLGSEMGVDTTLEVGTDPRMKQEYNDLGQEIADLKKEITRLEPVIRALGERMGKGEKLTIDQMKQAKLLSTTLAKNKEKLKQDMVAMSKLEIQLDQTTDASVRVTGQAFPGTRIVISEATEILKTPYHYCRFIKENGEVVMKGL